MISRVHYFVAHHRTVGTWQLDVEAPHPGGGKRLQRSGTNSRETDFPRQITARQRHLRSTSLTTPPMLLS